MDFQSWFDDFNDGLVIEYWFEMVNDEPGLNRSISIGGSMASNQIALIPVR